MNIEEMDLSARTYNCLKRSRIDTVEQLRKMSDDELYRVRGLGATCLLEIKEKLKAVCVTNREAMNWMADEELAEYIIKKFRPAEISGEDILAHLRAVNKGGDL